MVETIDEIWKDDLLDRRSDARMLQDFLVRRHAERKEAGLTGAYVVNLNAGWGHGKTFFLERFRRQLAVSGHPTAFVNAWKDDSSREPMIAVMAAIEVALKPYLAKQEVVRNAWNQAKANGAAIAASLLKGAAKKALTKVVGEGLDQVEDILSEQSWVSEDVQKALGEPNVRDAAVLNVTSLLTKYVDQKITDYQARIASAEEFQNRMREVLGAIDAVSGVNTPMFVLIDELDRCRPTYAIEMLEQVKHLFDVDNTIFIVATDGDQLAHSIKAVYGESFDGRRYLLRFFNRHYRFEQRDLNAYVRYLFETNKIDTAKISTPFNNDVVKFFVGAMKKYNVTLRDADQCFDILRSIVTVWDRKVPVHLSVMLPLIIFYQRHELERMASFIRCESNEGPNFKSEWLIETTEMDANGRVSRPVEVTVEALNSNLLNRAQKSLRGIYEYERGSPYTNYMCDVLQEEYQREHGNVHRGVEAMSILLDYPAIVRRIGKLATPSSEEGIET